MILSSLRSACYQRLGWGASPASDVTTRVDQFINDAIKEVLGDPTMQKLRRIKDLSFSTVANQSLCALPQAATDIHAILDANNRHRLDEVSMDWIDARDPGRTFSSSTPLAYAIVGYQQSVVRQPSASGQLQVDSTAVGDTGTAYVEVITSQGYLRTASVTMTGTTAVNIGPSDTVKVVNFYLQNVAVGEVFLTDGAGNELARIGIGKYRQKATVLEIYPKPSTAVSLVADVDISVTDLSNPTDETCIPEEHQEVIIEGVRMREYEKREKFDLAGACERKFNRKLGKLKLYVATKTALDDQSRPGFSQLGPYYPAGS